MSETIVIVGAGHAGGRAAQALRAAGFEGRVVLIGAERYPPYERPPLSKELLTSDDPLDKARLHKDEFYDDNAIELRTGVRAEAIDREAKTVTLSDGEALSYDKLLLTTGGEVRRLPAPGADLDGVYYVRDFDDTQAIRKRLKPGTKVAVIGGGFIGLESAASARTRGCEVTVIEATDRLMGRAVAPEVGEYFVKVHRGHGVDVRLSTKVARILGEGKVEGVEVEGVELEGGETVPAELVVVGIGIVPAVELAEAAGLECDNGIVVDEYGRTSDPHIWAAGDVANQPNAFLGNRVRLESYQNAQDQAMHVARNMIADEPTPYEDSLWVWTDQYDVNLQMAGQPDDYDEVVTRGDPESGSFALFYMKGGRIVAVNTINAGRDMRAAQRLMQSGKTVDPARLADPEEKLIKLAKE